MIDNNKVFKFILSSQAEWSLGHWRAPSASQKALHWERQDYRSLEGKDWKKGSWPLTIPGSFSYMVLGSLIVTARQFFGEPIRCDIGNVRFSIFSLGGRTACSDFRAFCWRCFNCFGWSAVAASGEGLSNKQHSCLESTVQISPPKFSWW